VSRELSRLDPFENLDATGETDRFVAFLDLADSRPSVIARRRRSYELAAVRMSDRVVEVGCGTGAAARELAELVGPEGAVTGIDASEEMIRIAVARGGNVTFLVADAAAIPLRDSCCDVYRAERLFQHLRQPLAALQEARRLLAAGGRIVLVDQDWDANLIDGDDVQTTRAILLGFSDSVANGWIGRRFRGLLLDAGFDDVRVEAETVTESKYESMAPFLPVLVEQAVAAGTVDTETADAWLEGQQRRGNDDRFFVATTHFLASARAS
jgi:ubiquinone/menaquinone biosynthesis C-methylase UbiE